MVTKHKNTHTQTNILIAEAVLSDDDFSNDVDFVAVATDLMLLIRLLLLQMLIWRQIMTQSLREVASTFNRLNVMSYVICYVF